MSADVLLVRPWSRRIPTVVPSLGLGYLAAVLEAAGHRVTVLDGMREQLVPSRFDATLSGRRFDVVGFQSFTCDLVQVKELAGIARRRLPEATILIGGPHASATPEHALGYLPECDFAFQGEAERGIVELLEVLASGADGADGVENLVFRSGSDGEVARGPRRFIDDIDSIPFPAWHLMPPESYPRAPHGLVANRFPAAPFLVSRGCPYRCTFCDAVSSQGRKLRARSMENVAAEIELLTERHGVEELHLEDDNFSTDRRLVRAFCETLLERERSLSWCCPNGMRLDTIDEELLTLMRRAGLYAFAVGIESGSPRVLDRMKKGLDLGSLREKLAIAQRLGIRTTGFFIVGFPGETPEDVRRTVDFACSAPLDHAQFSNFLPLPATAAQRELEAEEGFRYPPWEEFLTTGGRGWQPEGLDVPRLQRQAFRRFYLRPRVMLRVLRGFRGLGHWKYLFLRVVRLYV